jgi:hypothetical protein
VPEAQRGETGHICTYFIGDSMVSVTFWRPFSYSMLEEFLFAEDVLHLQPEALQSFDEQGAETDPEVYVRRGAHRVGLVAKLSVECR